MSLLSRIIQTIPHHESKPAPALTDPEDKVWSRLAFMLFVGVGMLVFLSFVEVDESYSIWKNARLWLTAFATCILVAGASYGIGIFCGFLFGIPKAIQFPSILPNKVKLKSGSYAHNDNLAQISDWLTKIIVGVGLTQLNVLPEKVHSMGEYLSVSFPGNDFRAPGFTANCAISTVFYFGITGFLTAYLFTTIYFAKMLSENEESADNNDLVLMAGDPEPAAPATTTVATDSGAQQEV